MREPPEALRAHVQSMPELVSEPLSEADTRAHLIDPMLRILGYRGVADVRREVMIPSTKEFIDYELRADGKPMALVEAKAVRHRLQDRDAAQCVQYATLVGAPWCIVTNGYEWAVYYAHAKVPLKEEGRPVQPGHGAFGGVLGHLGEIREEPNSGPRKYCRVAGTGVDSTRGFE
jgi:predicted type IV restriction endonuclease